jgi:hypothetical protein
MHGLRAAGKVLLSILVLMFSIPVHATAQDPRTGGPVPKSRVASTNVRFAAGQNALKIPIELSKNLILLQVRVNDSQPLWFVFDTGANTSVIDARLANELKLQTRGRVGGTGGGGKFISGLTGANLLLLDASRQRLTGQFEGQSFQWPG